MLEYECNKTMSFLQHKMLDLGIVKKDFSSLVGNVHPWMLSHFVMWLDIKVAEYKVYGHMVLGLLKIYSVVHSFQFVYCQHSFHFLFVLPTFLSSKL